MTGTRKKLRGLTLAALMVFSVFAGTVAFAGTAAAAANAQATQGDTSLGNSDAAGETTNFYASTAIESTDGSFSGIEVDFSDDSAFTGGGFASDIQSDDVEVRLYKGDANSGSDLATLVRDDNPEETTGSSVSGSNQNNANRFETLEVTGSSFSNTVQQGDLVVLVVENNEFRNPRNGGDYDAVVDYNPSSSGGESTAVLSVAGDGGDDGGTDDGPDATWDDRVIRYQGQDLFYNLNNKASEGGQLRSCEYDSTTEQCESSSLEQDLGTSTGEIDTSDLQGDYVITDSEGNYLEFNSGGGATGQNGPPASTDPTTEIVVQTLDTEFDDSSVSSGDSETLNFDSPVRSTYTVEVGADDLSQSDLQSMFSNAESAGTINNLQLEGSSNVTFQVTDTDQDVDVSFSGIDTGDYTLDIDVVDTTAEDTASIEVTEEDDLDANFITGSVVEERGDVAKFSLSLEETDQVTVIFGTEEANYEQEVTLEDDDDNGVVNFTFNTFQAGVNNERTFNVEDDVIVSSAINRPQDSSLNEPLEDYDYDVTAFVGDTETDVAVLTLQERSTNGAAIYTAPSSIQSSSGDAGTYDDAEELRDSITQSDTVAEGNHIVLQVNATGIFGYPGFDGNDDYTSALAEQDSASAAQFFDAGRTGAAGSGDDQVEGLLGLALTPEDVGPNVDAPDSLPIQDAVVYPDEDNNTLYVVFDPDDYSDANALETGDDYNASFTVPETESDGDVVSPQFDYTGNPYVADDDPSSDESEIVFDTFEFQERDLEFDTNEQGIVTVDAESGQFINGTTNLAPHTEFTVRARTTGNNAFLKEDTAEVQPDGTFGGEFDFSDVASNTSFTATVQNQNLEDNAETPGQVGSAQVGAATFSNQTFTGQATSLNVASVTVSEGGFVTIHDSTLVSDGAVFDSVRGTSGYLEAGTTENVTVELDSPIAPSGSGTYYAMPHLDSDGDETYDFVTSEGADDGPYTNNEGNATVDAATITVERVATVTLNDQTTNGDSVLVESARLPDGGFVTIHDATVSDDPFGSVRGTSAYLDSGTSADINVSLDTPVEESGQFFAMPHRDTDGDETYDFVSSNGDDDGPYLNADGQIVLDSGQISLAGEMTPTPTEADEPTPTPTEADEPTPTDGEETTTTSSDGQPGFGLAVSLIALVGAALIALRRRD
ncbi:DUF7282 domain-containing protein [Haloglomus halophilum]|uniref:DUF7282 domain-containing protein n=1 Tax=Haloglomus halophilum TaxID=2962672 RepID=UPI0020C9EA70|nr:BGTF surface domain-containing protein [Haloglomus halophilum]